MSDAAAARRAQRIKNLRTLSKTQPLLKLPDASAQKKRPLGILHRYRPVFLALAIFMLGSTIVQRRAVSAGDYVLAEHLEDTAMTVSAAGGDSISLSMGELAWYILKVEREGDRLAQAYNAEDTSAYWKLRISTASKGSYIGEVARDTVLDYAVRDMIYSMEAAKRGIELDEDEKEAVYYEAEREWLKMGSREKEATGLSVDTIAEALERNELLEKMSAILFEEGVADIDVGSRYYEELKKEYDVEYSREARESLRVGYVTIN